VPLIKSFKSAQITTRVPQHELAVIVIAH
jgi:hypothetical protein